MAKKKSVYICQECGTRRHRWEGRCSDCGAWNSFAEEREFAESTNKRGWSLGGEENYEIPQSVSLADSLEASSLSRTSTGLKEFDRVLGGGLVQGSYVLVGGDPGIGKSTLLLQMGGGLGNQNKKVLYVSGEESVEQSRLRAHRLGIHSENVFMAAESRLDTILELAQKEKPEVLVVDSIQTVFLSEIQSAPGSVSQVRECANQLMALAKSKKITVFLVGHVTKDGSLAGPRVLEHMVDTVLAFEGDNNHQFRLLRAYKNRFGATNELGVFQMSGEGLAEVENPSEFFLEDRGSELVGSAVFGAMEGSRPLLCEVQALANYSQMAMPRRTSLGVDTSRVHLLAAVLDKFADAGLGHQDVFVNVVGGLKITEPAADLAVAASLLSAVGHQEIAPRACFFGELGLTGEIRAASFSEERVREGEKLGFNEFYLPASNEKHLKKYLKNSNASFHWLKNIRQLQSLLGVTRKRHSKRTNSEPANSSIASPAPKN